MVAQLSCKQATTQHTEQIDAHAEREQRPHAFHKADWALKLLVLGLARDLSIASTSQRNKKISGMNINALQP